MPDLPPNPRWVKLLGIFALVLILLAVYVQFAGPGIDADPGDEVRFRSTLYMVVAFAVGYWSGKKARATIGLKLVAKDARIAELEQLVAKLSEQVATLSKQVEVLTEKLGRNSSNSHSPPSSDPPGVTEHGI